MSIMVSEDMDDFWRWFAQHSNSLRTIRSAEDAEYAELERRIMRVNAELSVEIGGTEESDVISLVVTAHGNERVFPIVDALVQRAPQICGWQIHGLKPPLLEDLEVQSDGEALRLGDLWFKVSSEPSPSKKVPIQIACKDFRNDDRANAALLVLESFLGERAYVSLIEVVEFVALPNDPAADGFAPIIRLAEMLGMK